MLFGDDRAHGPDVLLTERASTLRAHAGQVSFPGGGTDPDDAGRRRHRAARGRGGDRARPGRRRPARGAARAVHPAVRASSVTPGAGALGRIRRRCTRSTRARPPPSLRVPLAALADPRNRFQVRHPSGYVGPAFAVAGLVVWGFTGGLLSALLHLGGWERPWDEPGSGIWTRHGPRCGPTVGRSLRRERAGELTVHRGGIGEGGRRASAGRGPVSWVDVLVVLWRSSPGSPGGGTAWRSRCCRSSACSAARSWACSSPRCSPRTSRPRTRRSSSASRSSWCSSRWARPRGVYFGRRIRDRINGERTLAVDSALGSVLQALDGGRRGLAGRAAAGHGERARPRRGGARLAGAARGRRGHARRRARQLPADLRQVLDSSGFPDVLSPFAPTPITAGRAAESRAGRQRRRAGRRRTAS